MKKDIMAQDAMFLYTDANGNVAIQAKFEGDTLWLTKQQIADVFDTTKQNISQHIKNIVSAGELAENTTVKDFLTVVNRGFKGEISDQILHYNLDMIIAVGYRVNSVKATYFRIWATKVLREYIQKGFALDDKRLAMANRHDRAHFRELRERIKEIRVSEKMLYQQLKDIYALSADYDQDRVKDILFFQRVQNKMIFAVSGKTAPGMIYGRADAAKEKMGLTYYKNSPNGNITKSDVVIAKNYLEESEHKELKYIVNMFLDFAEHRVESEQVIFMKEWEQELDGFLTFNKKGILKNAGDISSTQAIAKAYTEYDKYKTGLKQGERERAVAEKKTDIKELEKLLKSDAAAASSE